VVNFFTDFDYKNVYLVFFFSSLTSSNGPSLQFKARVARQLGSGSGSGSGSAIWSKNYFLILELKPSRATRVLGSARVSRFGEPKLDPEPMIFLMGRA
jgi:hypothetical protein